MIEYREGLTVQATTADGRTKSATLAGNRLGFCELHEVRDSNGDIVQEVRLSEHHASCGWSDLREATRAGPPIAPPEKKVKRKAKKKTAKKKK